MLNYVLTCLTCLPSFVPLSLTCLTFSMCHFCTCLHFFKFFRFLTCLKSLFLSHFKCLKSVSFFKEIWNNPEPTATTRNKQERGRINKKLPKQAKATRDVIGELPLTFNIHVNITPFCKRF